MDGTDSRGAFEDLAADGVETTALTVIEEPQLPALPEGHAGYFAPAGTFEVDLKSMHLTVEIDETKLSPRASGVFEPATAWVFMVVVDADGYEYRTMKPYDEGFVPYQVARPDTYHALGLVLVTDEQIQFAKKYLFKRSVDRQSYAYPIVEHKEDGTPKMRGYAPLNWAIQTGVKAIEVTDEHVRVLADTWVNRWIQSPVFYQGAPVTDAGYVTRLLFGFLLQPYLWFIYMFGKGAYVTLKGFWHSVLFGSRGYDWAAMFDPDIERTRKAGWVCERYSRADMTVYGEINVQAPFARALVPAQWWKGVILGVAVANLFFAGTLVQMVIWSAVSVVGLAWLQFRIADNDGQYTAAWQYLLNNGGGMVRSLRISRIPYIGKYHTDINRWLSAQRAKIFRPVVAPKTIGSNE